MDITRWLDGKQWSRVEVDCRDGSKDIWIPTEHAQRLYSEGKLDKNITNYGVYCTPVNGWNNIINEPEVPMKKHI